MNTKSNRKGYYEKSSAACNLVYSIYFNRSNGKGRESIAQRRKAPQPQLRSLPGKPSATGTVLTLAPKAQLPKQQGPQPQQQTLLPLAPHQQPPAPQGLQPKPQPPVQHILPGQLNKQEKPKDLTEQLIVAGDRRVSKPPIESDQEKEARLEREEERANRAKELVKSLGLAVEKKWQISCKKCRVIVQRFNSYEEGLTFYKEVENSECFCGAKGSLCYEPGYIN